MKPRTVAVLTIFTIGAWLLFSRRGNAPTSPTPRGSVIEDEAVASFYGPTGNPTANGEPYDGKSLTAAHKTLPFGTLVRVTDLDLGGSVIVRINDRGPFVAGRSIDLSVAAAQAIDLDLRRGTARVRLERVG